ncbi:MAG: GerMN domain-containing protein [Candidatus Margulisiibacteriota bacterium]
MTKKLLKRIGFFAAIAALAIIVIGSYYLGQRTTKEQRSVMVSSPATDEIAVKLYCYNKLKDKDRSLLPEFVLPVARTIPRTKSLIKDTLDLLLKGELIWKEKASGFETEFPHPDFKLKSATLRNGVLTLEFPEVPGFTSGGAGRIGLLSAQIRKTAKQFPQVKIVRFEPEYLFQP